MQPMMVEAVLGPRYATVDPILKDRVTEEVRALIDRTTGVQTLVQMRELIDLVLQFGFVARDERIQMGCGRIWERDMPFTQTMLSDRVQACHHIGRLPRDDDACFRRLIACTAKCTLGPP